ncbi:protein of unknown function [Clostridium beijerinckii]|nr:protein of unknown function [Clostridium beijerinckii]
MNIRIIPKAILILKNMIEVLIDNIGSSAISAINTKMLAKRNIHFFF